MTVGEKERALHVTIIDEVEEKKWKHVNYRCIFGCSLGHVAVGVTMICISAPVTHWQFRLNRTGYGIWCGIIFILTGLSGLLANHYKDKKPLVIVYMLMSLLSVGGASIVLILTIVGDFTYSYHEDCEFHCGAKHAVSAVQDCFGGIEFLVASYTCLLTFIELFCSSDHGEDH